MNESQSVLKSSSPLISSFDESSDRESKDDSTGNTWLFGSL